MDPLAPRSVSRHTTTPRGPRIPESYQPGSGHAPPEVPKGGGRRETGTGKCSRRIRACDLTRPTRNNLASARLFAARSLLHRPALTMGRITTPGRGEAVISSSGGASSTPAPQLGNGDDEVDYAGPQTTGGHRPSSPRPLETCARGEKGNAPDDIAGIGITTPAAWPACQGPPPPDGIPAFFPTGRPWRWETAATVAR